MPEMRQTERMVKQYLLELTAPADSEAESRTLADALAAMRKTKPQPEPLGVAIGRTLLGSRVARVAVAVATVVVALFIATRTSRPVWAMDQVIEMLRRYKACNLTMVDAAGVVYDCWAKAEPSGELSDELTMKGSNGTAIWVKGGKTYYYNRDSNTVDVDDAKTAGFQPWLGPELMKMIAKADDARTMYATDPATGREIVVMTGSMMTAIGHISWSIEFDKESKLPVAFKQWNNPRRSGAPSMSIVRIVYYRELPEGMLAMDVPANAIYRQKPIVLPEANLELLDRMGPWISAEGMTRAEAARMILGRVYKASMAGDLATIRRLCPLTALWNDEMLKAVIINEDESKRLAELKEIGGIVREGYDRLGPFVVVPARLKTRDGRLWDEKQIVQFRQIDGRDSCVVYGPYGMISEVK